MIYVAIVHHQAGSAYGLHFPDLPDVFAAADEAEHLLNNATVALADYFSDGHSMPRPRSIEEIKQIAKKDLDEGATLLLVPFASHCT